MSAWQALLMGIVQGVTEFIPISSTAHVTLFGMLLGMQPQQMAQQWTGFLASIQLGSLAALVGYFRAELIQMGQELSGVRADGSGQRLFWALLLASLPIGVAGIVLKPLIEGPVTKEPLVIAAALTGVSLLMAGAEWGGRRERSFTQLRWYEVLLIGLAQVLALVPGSSRSGSTIAAAMLVGLSRQEAARFSFLLGIPAIAASGLLELRELLCRPLSIGSWQMLGISFIAAWVSSYGAIAFLLGYLRTHTLWLFIVYRLIVAGAIGLVSLMSHP